MRRLLCLATVVALVSPGLSSRAPGEASGTVTVTRMGTIAPTHALAYLTRDRRNARESRTEILLTDAVVDAAAIQAAFDPHMVAINDEAIRDRNYVLLWADADGAIGMNATFSKTMTQFVDDTSGGLRVTWTTRSAARLEGRVYSTAPLRTMDGTTYTVDLRFAVDVPPPAAGDALPAGGGDPGKALLAFFAAVAAKDWDAIRAASSPAALQIFDKSYNTPQENAADVADLVDAWIPKEQRVVARGLLSGASAMLDVEGEMFPGTMGLSRVRMVKAGSVWQFDRAAMAGMLP
jgi:hypothetical protein